jgi:hypothetical protein
MEDHRGDAQAGDSFATNQVRKDSVRAGSPLPTNRSYLDAGYGVVGDLKRSTIRLSKYLTPIRASLNASGLSNINKTGLTQIKVCFATDDDNDTANDYLTLFDGANVTYRPKLDVTWQ